MRHSINCGLITQQEDFPLYFKVVSFTWQSCSPDFQFEQEGQHRTMFLEKSGAINKSLHPADKQQRDLWNYIPALPLLLLFLLLFQQLKELPVTHPLPKEKLGMWHILGAGNAESTEAGRQGKWI